MKVCSTSCYLLLYTRTHYAAFSHSTAVIMNEHLMEALRRLRKSSSDMNVDRRLVTNILLSFLNTPRGDTKRFEMLSLLASILQWSDDERERAGLQRKSAIVPNHANAHAHASLWGRSRGKETELDKTDETEVSITIPTSLSLLA